LKVLRLPKICGSTDCHNRTL